MDVNSAKRKQQVQVAYKGLEQLHQFDGRDQPNFSIQLEQNPFPKPDNYDDKRARRVEQMMREQEEKERRG